MKKLSLDKLYETIDYLQERLRSFWFGLNPREKTILASAAGALVLTLFVLLVQQAANIFQHRISSERAMQEIKEIQKLGAEIAATRMEARQYERMQQELGEDFDLENLILQRANRYGVSVQTVDTEQIEDNSYHYRVDLAEETSLDSAIRLLVSVEDAIGVSLEELEMLPNNEDPSEMRVNAVFKWKRET